MSTLKKCDRCSKHGEVNAGNELPEDWETVDELDLCEDCMKDFRAFMRNEEVKPRKEAS